MRRVGGNLVPVARRLEAKLCVLPVEGHVRRAPKKGRILPRSAGVFMDARGGWLTPLQ